MFNAAGTGRMALTCGGSGRQMLLRLGHHKHDPSTWILGRNFATDQNKNGGETATMTGDSKEQQQQKIAMAADQRPQGLLSRILTGPKGGDTGGSRHSQSHSSQLSVGEAIYEIQTHDATGGDRERYVEAYKKYAAEVKAATPGAELFGSWFVLFGNQNQVVNLWRYQKGYSDLDSHINALQRNSALKAAELDYARLCGRRRTVITKPFSFWGEPKPREPSHVYDLRSYVLKPGSMIEWGNAWAKGITYRREFNQDVAGFFSQMGQLYMVFHIWAYPSLVSRNNTRQLTWAKPGWDTTVEYTVPLIKKMQSRILVPNELSKLK